MAAFGSYFFIFFQHIAAKSHCRIARIAAGTLKVHLRCKLGKMDIYFLGVQAEEEGRKRIVGGRKVGPRVRESGVNL